MAHMLSGYCSEKKKLWYFLAHLLLCLENCKYVVIIIIIIIIIIICYHIYTGVFTIIYLKQNTPLGNTVLQLFCSYNI
jgi:hypothetical protein